MNVSQYSRSHWSAALRAGAKRSRTSAPNRSSALQYLRLRHQLPQHVGQNAAVLVIVDLDRRVDPAAHGDIFHLALGARDAEGQVLARRQVRVQAEHVVALGAIQLQSLSAGDFLEL